MENNIFEIPKRENRNLQYMLSKEEIRPNVTGSEVIIIWVLDWCQ